MLFTAAAFSLIGMTTASPLLPSSSNFPPRDTGKAFNIVVNVTNLSRDFAPSVHGAFLTALHREPSKNYIGVGDGASGPIFFINGTDAEAAKGTTRMLADLGVPGIPFSTQLEDVNGQFVNQIAELNAGPDGEYITVSSDEPASVINLSSPGLCRENINGQEYAVLHRFLVGNDHERIPKECVPVNLIPQCAEQIDSPEDHHLFAREVKCYNDVGSIDWSKYDAFRL
ncbi:hypothetical protein V2A60_006443 [Cordyceps javanica]